jgi:hypothetical protein
LAVAAADLNHDGKLDLVVGTASGPSNVGAVSVLLGNGDGTFQPEHSYSTGGHTITSVAVADLNGDGKLDVVVSQQEGLAVLLGNGNGVLRAAHLYPIASYGGTSSVTIADVNQDGKPDLVASLECTPAYNDCGHGGAAGVFLGKGNAVFGPLQFYASGGNDSSSIVVADMDGDGKPDLVISNELSASGYEHGSVGILRGNGDGTFQAAQTYDMGGFNGGSIVVGDLNHDGIMDVVAANHCADANCNISTASILLGNGDGSLRSPKIIATGGWSATTPALADIDGDGNLDLVLNNWCNNSVDCSYGVVRLLFGKGDGTFVSSQQYNTVPNAMSMSLGDVNGDGVPDVLIAGGPGGILLSVSPTTALLGSSLNPSIYGQAVTLTATVHSPTVVPGGQVKFESSKHVIGSATLNSTGVATFTDSKLAAGSYSLTAVYAGDSNNLGSSSVALEQTVEAATSSATIASSANPSKQGQSVTFTATVTSPTTTPTGQVTFTAGTTVLGTAQLAGGKAKLSTTSLPVGSTTISVTYQGSANISGSSVSLVQNVQ